MTRTPFEGLTLLRRTGACVNGCTEVCRDPAGAEVIRLRITRTSLQRSLLRDRPADLPVRMQGTALELLLPPVQGQTLGEWLYFRRPTWGSGGMSAWRCWGRSWPTRCPPRCWR